MSDFLAELAYPAPCPAVVETAVVPPSTPPDVPVVPVDPDEVDDPDDEVELLVDDVVEPPVEAEEPVLPRVVPVLRLVVEPLAVGKLSDPPLPPHPISNASAPVMAIASANRPKFLFRRIMAVLTARYLVKCVGAISCGKRENKK